MKTNKMPKMKKTTQIIPKAVGSNVIIDSDSAGAVGVKASAVVPSNQLLNAQKQKKMNPAIIKNNAASGNLMCNTPSFSNLL